MPSELILVEPGAVRVVDYDEPPLEAGQVRAEALLSGISHGTELALYRGATAFGGRRFDLDLRLFVDDAENAYPMRLGYEWVGVVREAGASVRGVRVGDTVQLALPHRRTQTVAIDESPFAPWSVLPPDLEPERAMLLHSTTIALAAIHDARLKVGDRVAVSGLGTLGLLAVQLARLNGASWIAGIDPIASRRELAAQLGADATIDPAASDPAVEIKRVPTGGVDVAIEFSGSYGALHTALRCVRMAGTVVAAGLYVGPAGSDLRLGEEWTHNRLTLVSSMSGWGNPARDEGWDRRRLRATALDLLASGRLRTDGFVTHRVPFERAAEAYELIDSRPEEVLRVVLTY
jgi:2-desacetyl-2-hydroxyethyl bacteriochlorophyllide A dehydrogenase